MNYYYYITDQYDSIIDTGATSHIDCDLSEYFAGDPLCSVCHVDDSLLHILLCVCDRPALCHLRSDALLAMTDLMSSWGHPSFLENEMWQKDDTYRMLPKVLYMTKNASMPLIDLFTLPITSSLLFVVAVVFRREISVHYSVFLHYYRVLLYVTYDDKFTRPTSFYAQRDVIWGFM